MCATCGCSAESVTVTGRHHTDASMRSPASDSVHAVRGQHEAGHEHPHGLHPHDELSATRTVTLEQDVLAKNDLLAAINRTWFAEHRILALNLMSSPGSGKTTLLERTIAALGAELVLSVVEGDQETLLDADRIHAAGCEVVQINTGQGCHLDGAMLARGLQTLQPPDDSVVLIENVGNLVCPALFDLGESARVVIMSVTEGADKPRKYPHMFRDADLLILNKMDLLPYVDFDVDRCEAEAQALNPDLRVVRVSATSGEGMEDWFMWLRQRRAVGPA